MARPRRTANQFGPSGAAPGSTRNPIVIRRRKPAVRAGVRVPTRLRRTDPPGLALLQIRRGEWALVEVDHGPPFTRAEIAEAWWLYRTTPARDRPPIVTTAEILADRRRRWRVVDPVKGWVTQEGGAQ